MVVSLLVVVLLLVVVGVVVVLFVGVEGVVVTLVVQGISFLITRPRPTTPETRAMGCSISRKDKS